MALRFIDSFDHYVTADFTSKWTDKVTGGTIIISSGNGRNSTSSARYSSFSSGSNDYLLKTLDAQATWILGFGIKRANLPTATVKILVVADAGSTQVDVRLNADGTFTVTRNGTTLGTTTFAISTGIYYYFEFKVFINDTTGTYEIRIDGSSKLSGTGADTKATSNATANQIYFGALNTIGTDNGVTDIDDLYICDGTGSANNDFLGDRRVEVISPTGAGTTTNFTPDSGSNYARVNEASQDGDTSYVESSNAGDIDTYAFGNLSSTPQNINGIQTNIWSRKTDAGVRTIAPMIRSGGTNYQKTSVNLTDSYLDNTEIVEQDPNTSAAWTESGVNAAEFGVKLVA